MKKFIIIAVLLIGCGPLLKEIHDEFRANNRAALNNLEIGMSKSQVHEIMGRFHVSEKSRWDKKAELTNPYRTSAFTRDTLVIDIFWYHTDMKSADGAVTDDELTPVILFNNKVIGWGNEFWFDTAEKYEIRVR